MTEETSQVIAGRYRLVARLGHGGMGVVWQARDELLGRDVAVKEIRVSVPDDAVDLLARRALREARAAARLRHPGIVMVHDIVTDDGRPWIVMELVRGRSLAQVIDADGPLSALRAAEIGRQVLDALGAAHRRGILHRDVKPANILLDGDRVVLTDFGIAAIDGATALTATGLLVGSPNYLAPERIDGHPPTAAVDMWGLGVTLYTAVAGHPPFHRDDTRSTLAAVLVSDPKPLASAPELWPVVRGLLAKDPEARLTLAAAVPLLAATMGTPPTAPSRRRRRPAMFPARSRVEAPADRDGEQPPAAAGAPAEAEPESPPIATTPSAPPTVPTADSGPPSAPPTVPLVDSGPSVGTRSRARMVTLIAVSAVVVLLAGALGWLAQRGPDDPLVPRAAASSPAVSSPAGAGIRTTSPAPSPTTPSAPAGFALAHGAGWTIVVPRSMDPVSAGLWGDKESESGTDDVWISVRVSYYARNARVVADKELTGSERGYMNDAGYADYDRIRLTRRLPTVEGAGSVAEIEYTRQQKFPKAFSPIRASGKATSLRFDLSVEPQRPAEARGIIHWWGYSRSIDRAFVTKQGNRLYVVSVTVATDSSKARRLFWPKERTTFATILNSFRFD